jgi:hypothetical protein
MPNDITRGQRAVVAGAVALASAVCLGALAAALAPQTAQALPKYAERTGLACGRCHVDPEGGGPRTAFGRAFAANGHHLPGKSRGNAKSDSAGDHGSDDDDGGMMEGHGHGMMGHGMMHGY